VDARAEAGPRPSATRRLTIALGLIALYFVPTFAILEVIGKDQRTLASFCRHGRKTAGIVKSIRTEGSGSVLVEFDVDGHRRSAESRFIGKPNPRLPELRVGQSVELWYLPDDPSVVAVGDPRRLRRGDVSGPVAMLLGFVLWLAALRIWSWRQLARRAS